MYIVINSSRTAWPTKILIPFLRFSDSLLQDSHTVFQNSVDNFEIVHNAQFCLKMQFSFRVYIVFIVRDIAIPRSKSCL